MYFILVLTKRQQTADKMVEIAVIGAGMIGSSAAKYVAAEAQSSVLIGPDHPLQGIHAAWFDEGRITRKIDRNPNWRILGRLLQQLLLNK